MGHCRLSIPIPSPSIKPVSLSLPCSPLFKTPKQVFFNPINIFDIFYTLYLLFYNSTFFRFNVNIFIFTDLKLKQARAHVKRYSKDTSAKEGPNEIKEKKFVALVEKLDAHHVHAQHSVKRHQSRVDYKMKACSGAFVTFQHEESFLRALQDYNGSTRCCGRLFQPNALRFRPKRGTANPKQHLVPLVVVQADEPTNIIWEHLNTTTNEINIRR